MLLFLVALQSLSIVIEKSKAVSFATQRTQVKLTGDVTCIIFVFSFDRCDSPKTMSLCNIFMLFTINVFFLFE